MMTWTTPSFDELKMDAEIGSYQEDTDPGRDSPIAELPVDGSARTAG